MIDSAEQEHHEPSARESLTRTISTIQNQQADTFPEINPGGSLRLMENLRTDSVPNFFDRTRDYLQTVFATVHDEGLSDELKINNLGEKFEDIVTKQTFHPMRIPLVEQAIRLGALTFVGETEEKNRETQDIDPKTVEKDAITLKFREIDKSNLSEEERRIFIALTTGIEIGYKSNGAKKIDQLTSSINTFLDHRQKAPNAVGDDFIEAILVAHL